MSGKGALWLERLERRWSAIETRLIGGLVIAALAVYLYGSAVRTLAPSLAIDWAEEVAIYLIVWASMLTGGMLAAEGRHVSAGVAARILSPRAAGRLRIAVESVMLLFSVTVAVLGVQGVLFADMLDERSASTLQVPQAWALYLALPVGMTLIAVRVMLRLVRGVPAGSGELPATGAPERSPSAGASGDRDG